MDAPPSHEDCRPYIRVAELFGAAGAHVPQVIKQNLEQGFLLLSDLGSTTCRRSPRTTPTTSTPTPSAR